MSEYLNEISEATELLTKARWDLQKKALAFYEVGNREMGEYMKSIADDMNKSCEMFNNAVTKQINDSLKATQDQTVNMVGAVIESILDESEDAK